jgi:D-arabinose 1-dehydrogenase-like Zn-dependent alcohol dehydrogenase
MSLTGKAAVFVGTGKPFEIREYPVTEPPPGMALIKVSMANVCGSDLHIWRGEYNMERMGRALPRIIGHEMTGRIAALGEGVTHDSSGEPLKEGDRIVYRYFYPCGQCRICLKGRPGACRKGMAYASVSCETPPHFLGAFAEYYYLQRNYTIFKVPDDLSDELVAPINCALSQVIEGLLRAQLRFGEYVVIQGAGGLGVYATAVAKDMGAERVVVIDGVEERLQLAREFGADATIDLREFPTPEERVKRAHELTDGGADVVLEVAGFPRVVPEGLDMLADGGRYVEIGNISPGLTYTADPSVLVWKCATIYGVRWYEAESLKKALDFLRRARNRYPFHKLLSHKYPLEDINRAFEESDKGHVTRAALVMGG